MKLPYNPFAIPEEEELYRFRFPVDYFFPQQQPVIPLRELLADETRTSMMTDAGKIVPCTFFEIIDAHLNEIALTTPEAVDSILFYCE